MCNCPKEFIWKEKCINPGCSFSSYIEFITLIMNKYNRCYIVEDFEDYKGQAIIIGLELIKTYVPMEGNTLINYLWTYIPLKLIDYSNKITKYSRVYKDSPKFVDIDTLPPDSDDGAKLLSDSPTIEDHVVNRAVAMVNVTLPAIIDEEKYYSVNNIIEDTGYCYKAVSEMCRKRKIVAIKCKINNRTKWMIKGGDYLNWALKNQSRFIEVQKRIEQDIKMFKEFFKT